MYHSVMKVRNINKWIITVMPGYLPPYTHVHVRRETTFIITTGEAGRRVGCSKPFDDLDADHSGQERGFYDFEKRTEGNTKWHFQHYYLTQLKFEHNNTLKATQF